ncbi:ribosome recycling factor [bacterium]|jgi:ribosome recycling factor|nr:ribosome recycling factor [bacterium]NBX78178.1 ribosome recycling factor [bacterium]
MISKHIQENNIKGFETSLKSEMDKPLQHFEKDIATIRTGRAHASLVEDIKAECYGSMMGIKELAAISIPASNQIMIQPWDKGTVSSIEKAIANSQLGINPQVDGDIIRLELPKMSADRRADLVKVLGKKTEDTKVNIRNIRKDVQNVVRDFEKNKTISEDFAKRFNKILQDVTDHYTKLIDTLSEKKKTEISSL